MATGSSHESFALPPLHELYNGLLPNLIKEAPSSALYLGIYELVRSGLMAPGAPFESAPLLAYLVAGAVGEFVGSVGGFDVGGMCTAPFYSCSQGKPSLREHHCAHGPDPALTVVRPTPSN